MPSVHREENSLRRKFTAQHFTVKGLDKKKKKYLVIHFRIMKNVLLTLV